MQDKIISFNIKTEHNIIQEIFLKIKHYQRISCRIEEATAHWKKKGSLYFFHNYILERSMYV